MKTPVILLILLFNFTFLKAQWFCGDSYTLNFEDTFCVNLSIDTVSNPNNIWQIGKPQKTVFNSARSSPNVIVTDTTNPYPPNDTSVFIVKHIAGQGFVAPHTVVLSGYYQVNSDSLNDFGQIEFSPDNGGTWIDLLYDTTYNSYYWWSTQVPVLTGNSNGWQQFYVNLADLGPLLNIQYGDTVIYKFTFISDSIIDSLDGLMFDDLNFQDWAEGIEELSYQLIKSNVYPNPATNNITIEYENSKASLFNLTIYDNSGKLVYERLELEQTPVEIDVSQFNSGLYYYKLISSKVEKRSLGKILIEK